MNTYFKMYPPLWKEVTQENGRVLIEDNNGNIVSYNPIPRRIIVTLINSFAAAKRLEKAGQKAAKEIYRDHDASATYLELQAALDEFGKMAG